MNETINWIEENHFLVDNVILPVLGSEPSQNDNPVTEYKDEPDIIDLTCTKADRRKNFIINDSYGEPHESYSAKKKFVFKSSFHSGFLSSSKKLKMTTFVVSDHGNQKFNNVLRTLFCH